MVKILKHGTTYLQKCTECVCEFTYMKNDTSKWMGSKYIEITCPDCGKVLNCTFEKWEETK